MVFIFYTLEDIRGLFPRIFNPSVKSSGNLWNPAIYFFERYVIQRGVGQSQWIGYGKPVVGKSCKGHFR